MITTNRIGLDVITEEKEDETLGVADCPEENFYSNMIMIQPRKKKGRNKSTNSKSQREPLPSENQTALRETPNQKQGKNFFFSLSLFTTGWITANNEERKKKKGESAVRPYLL